MVGRDCTRIQPTGAYAANILGLSEQVPAKVVFLTDGPSRTVKIGLTTIQLRRTTAKNMAMAGRLSGLLIQALQWGYKEYHIPLQWIEHNLLGTLPSSEIERIVGEALVYAKQNSCITKNIVLLHNDLHGGNLAFDMNIEQVTGVFDFSDAAIGDYSIEFGKLFNIHQDLAVRTSEAYANLNDVANPTIPAHDEIMGIGLFSCHYDFFFRCIWFAVANIF